MSHTADAPCAGLCALRPNTMDRRAFLSAAAIASVTLALTACGDGQIGGLTGPGSLGLAGGTLTLNLADFGALSSIGGVARVTQTGTPIAVYRSGASTFEAFSMRCPHQGTTIRITSTGFTCPNHSARFGKDGIWLGGKSTSNLVSIPVTFDPVTGTLTLTDAGGTTPTGGGTDDDDLRAP
jgi:Rieske Fe-S protein